MLHRCLLFLTLTLLLPASTFAAEPTPLEQAQASIAYFHEVTPGVLYRGAIPTQNGFEALKRLGIKTDISLLLPTERHSAIVRERKDAAAAGIRLVYRPMVGGWDRIDEKEVENVLDIIRNPDNQPVYVHCRFGWDRTGMVVALHRVLNEGKDPSEAWREMLQYKFHRIWLGLSCTFREMTGFNPQSFCKLLPHYRPVLED
jgi:tyrosine-protein phosphatase SIW14